MELAGGLVAKQSLGKLQVKEEWLADRARIWSEAGVMRRLAAVLPGWWIPEVVFEDRENYLYVMGSGARGFGHVEITVAGRRDQSQVGGGGGSDPWRDCGYELGTSRVAGWFGRSGVLPAIAARSLLCVYDAAAPGFA